MDDSHEMPCLIFSEKKVKMSSAADVIRAIRLMLFNLNKAPHKRGYPPKIFLIFPQKLMLWVLIRSALQLVRHL